MQTESYSVMRILSIQEAAKVAAGKRPVIITGVTGQDGSFMADFLLKNTNHLIFGGARRLSVSNHENIDHLANEPRFNLINFDLTDAHSIEKIVSQLKPSYFINFAAQSFVKSSWDFPAQTWETNTTGVLHILEALHLHAPCCRFYNAGSSEEFGDVSYAPQDEKHPLRPRSPYGASKAAARQLVKVYRESYNLYALQGWLFNHEGTRRGEEFVTRKLSKGVARIVKEMSGGENAVITPIELGNLDAVRDWSDAEDCVEAVWRMLNQEEYSERVKAHLPSPDPDGYYSAMGWNQIVVPHLREYVVGSGESHSIREFVEWAFMAAGVKGSWVGENMAECFMATHYGKPVQLVTINPANYRPAEVEKLQGNSTLIRHDLGWAPKTTFKELVWKMVSKDLGRK